MPLNVPSPLWTQCKEREREREGKVEKRVEVEWRKNRAELDAEEGCVRDKDSRATGFETGEEEREGKVSARFDGLILRRHRFDYLSTSILRVTLAYVCYIGKNCLPSYDRF